MDLLKGESSISWMRDNVLLVSGRLDRRIVLRFHRFHRIKGGRAVDMVGHVPHRSVSRGVL